MRLPHGSGSFFAVRRDATVPTTVVVVTQVAAAATAATSSSDPTITVLTTITAGSGSTSSPAVSTSARALAITLTSLARTSALATHSTNSASTSSVSPLSSVISKTTATSLTLDTAITLLISPSLLSSTRLGLAIGIPIAVVSIFGLVSVSSMYLSSDVEQGYGQHYENRPPPIAALGQKPTFLKRISRLMNVPESPLEFRSPVFLRRFHLNSTKNEAEVVDKQEKALPKSPLSHAYDASIDHTKQEYPEREIASKVKVPELTYVVTKPYARRLGDELTVCIGEKVSIVDHHSDGWATVKLAETGDVGVIPLMCIKKVHGQVMKVAR
ncbi:hypothetical protein HF325_000305 [Metschnikowia pulcherrima]|uniref:SH3 domain-containing protein n=1 Tax=Metschnikowia pulcherrima TaxID=27326 RepID=A0A8H7GWQ7_9ASCO|nr:hypothetical protein HF325_000305 [Metschnikowia pulcherrima]